MDTDIINKLNLIYPILIDSTILHTQTEEQLVQLIGLFKQKFETKFG